VNCCLFVARIYDSDTLTFATIIDSSNMSSAKGEDNLDTFSFQNFGDEPAAVDHAHGNSVLYLNAIIVPWDGV
jgi:hypothetical protein